jgi:hypothetical protein
MRRNREMYREPKQQNTAKHNTGATAGNKNIRAAVVPGTTAGFQRIESAEEYCTHEEAQKSA